MKISSRIEIAILSSEIYGSIVPHSCGNRSHVMTSDATASRSVIQVYRGSPDKTTITATLQVISYGMERGRVNLRQMSAARQ